MKEYFIFANSFAAPFFSDSGTHFQKGKSAGDALNKFAASYKHPCGLYSAAAYDSAESYHKDGKILARWLCNQARILLESNYTSLRQDEPGVLIMDGKPVKIENPKEGQVVA